MPGEEVEKEEETSKLAMVLGVAAVGVLSLFSGSLFSHLSQFFLHKHYSSLRQEKLPKFYLKVCSNLFCC